MDRRHAAQGVKQWLRGCVVSMFAQLTQLVMGDQSKGAGQFAPDLEHDQVTLLHHNSTGTPPPQLKHDHNRTHGRPGQQPTVHEETAFLPLGTQLTPYTSPDTIFPKDHRAGVVCVVVVGHCPS